MILIVALACGGTAAKEPASTEQAPTQPAQAAEDDVSWDGTKEAAAAMARAAIEAELGHEVGTVKTVARKQAPEGVFVVKALGASERHDDDTARFCVVTEAGVELDLGAARALVANAWGYGPERSVDAGTFAAVMGPLTGENGTVVTSEADLEGLREVLREGLSAPAEIERDGQPGVAFDTRGTEGSWRTTAWVAEDRTVPVEITQHGF